MLAAIILGTSFYQKDTGAGKHHYGILPLAYQEWDQPHPPTRGHQYWDALGQAANRVGTQAHPPADQLPQDPLNTQTQATHQCTGTSPGTPGALQSAIETLSVYQWTDTNSGTPKALQPETSRPSSAHQQAETNPRITQALTPPTNGQTPVPELPQPCSHHCKDLAHPPGDQHQLQDPLGPSPVHHSSRIPQGSTARNPNPHCAYQQTSNSSETQWAPQPAALGFSPFTSQLTPGLGHPGPSNGCMDKEDVECIYTMEYYLTIHWNIT